MRVKNHAVLFLISILGCVILGTEGISANLKFKVPDEFVNNLLNDVRDLVTSAMSDVKYYWTYYKDFSSTFGETEEGKIWIWSFSTPVVTYQPSGGQYGGYDYIKVRVPKVELKWTYEYWFTPLSIPIYWGMGYNYYAISDLEFKFSFRPPQYHYGSLGNGNLNLDSSSSYGSFWWTRKAGEGDQYGDELRYYRSSIISSIHSRARSKISSNYQFQRLQDTMNNAVRKLPSMMKWGLIESSDSKTLNDLKKLEHDRSMQFATKLIYNRPHFWMYISVTPTGAANSFNLIPPRYDLEVQLDDVAYDAPFSDETLLTILQNTEIPLPELQSLWGSKNLGDLSANVTFQDGSVRISRKRKDEDEWHCSELVWSFTRFGLNPNDTVNYSAKLSFYTTEPVIHETRVGTTFAMKSSISCDFIASVEDVTPKIDDDQYTMMYVTQRITKMQKAIDSFCEAREDSWKMMELRGMKFDSQQFVKWTRGGSFLDMSFKTNVDYV